MWEIGTADGETLHSQRVERIRCVGNSDIVINTGRDQLWAQDPKQVKERFSFIGGSAHTP